MSVFAVVDSSNGTVVSGPEVHARGLAEDDSVFDAILPKIKSALEEAAATGTADNHQLQQVMRRVLGRYVGTKPASAPDDHPDRHRVLRAIRARAGWQHPARRMRRYGPGPWHLHALRAPAVSLRPSVPPQRAARPRMHLSSRLPFCVASRRSAEASPAPSGRESGPSAMERVK
ncbi:hypothetical protein GCM10025876_33080 [Demequina litorisediminis]|uniref:Ribonuclease J C-terminal domain-containing protein n=1 Tax=Demequina litorisediminis TaxID=1849022 RepID=A0ABQ6IGX1_9MICO|nr:hypothetical protein GCM10025876_33080 [Demequina litorisediminis]